MRSFPLSLSVAVAGVLATASAAAASTFPLSDIRAGERVFQLGAVDASFDYGLSDTWSLGLVGASAPGPVYGGARATQRLLGERDGPHLALSYSAGVANVDPYQTYIDAPPHAWVSPGAVVSLPYWFQRGQFGLALRASVGPAYFQSLADAQRGLFLLGNAELALLFGRSFELSLGGNALFGLRARF